MHDYRICGLSVSSEIPLPGLIAGSPGAPDVRIRTGAVPRSLPSGEQHATYQIAGDEFLLSVGDVARFLLRGGREVVVEHEPGAAPEEAAIFILGTVFGILLHQREQLVLHASAVRVGSTAVLFCGRSGAGKSTIAAALGQRGYPLVTDDVCAIETTGAVPRVHPDGRQLKLWAEAVDRLGLGARRGAKVRNRMEKFYMEPGDEYREALPLGAIYMLREARAGGGIIQPNIVDAAVLIRRSAYRPKLVRLMRQNANYLRAAAGLIAKAGVFVLARPLDFAVLPRTLDGLEEHWRTLGLCAS